MQSLKSMKSFQTISFVFLIYVGCTICDSCVDTVPVVDEIASLTGAADMVLRGSLIEQEECAENGGYSEVYILQECFYGIDGSSMSASTFGGTPKHLIRGLNLCNLQKDSSYIFFLNLQPAPLFSEALKCLPTTIEDGIVLYANETSVVIPISDKTEDQIENGIFLVADSKSCASAKSSNQPEQPPFQSFCKCSTFEDIDASVDVTTEVVDSQSPDTTESVVVVDRVSDVVIEGARVIDEDRQVSFDDGTDENGVLENSVTVLGSAVLASIALLAFIY
eukprot:TRINITY_DN52114_c0_g1_i2.p1 TRINITY_DN52114_c0_g1~~TRINITY_DN52114_c0_g1_i2.p1  ORF type:complete len:278 (-),score=46.48 TRINITY_DN52114_c0_g1_i2:162-995(-)